MNGNSSLTGQRDQKLKQFRNIGVHGSVIKPHRSMAAFQFLRSSLQSMIGIPLVLISVTLLGLPHITLLWKVCFSYAFEYMGLGTDVHMYTLKILPHYYLDIPSCSINAEWPKMVDFCNVGIAFIAIFVISFLFSENLTPFAYFLKILCFVQMTAFVYFKFAIEPFPYDLSGYMANLLRGGIVIVLLVPILFAITLYLYNMPLVQKMLVSIITMGHLMIFIPLQALIHMYVIKACSYLMLPTMFFLFGHLLEIYIVISFYGWAVSWVDDVKI